MNAINNSDVLEFALLQRQLLLEFSKTYPKCIDYKWLTDFPVTGGLRVGESEWIFSKHGAGLRFSRLGDHPNLVVDAHKYIDNPYSIDEWRLEQYFESRDGGVSHVEVSILLADMCAHGALIKQRDGQYLLTKSVVR